MPYDLAGNFTRVYNWVQDRDNGIKIQAARMDTEFDGIATALSGVLLRSGVAAMTGTLKLGNQVASGLGDGSVGAPAIGFNTEATTGLYMPAAGSMAFTVAGTQRLLLNSTGAIAATLSGGTAAGSGLILQSTTGAGTTDSVSIKTGSQVQAAKWETGGALVLGNVAVDPLIALQSAKSHTGSTVTTNIQAGGTIQSGVTTSHSCFSSFPSTAVAAFALLELSHFKAATNIIGAGSSITAQMGFYAPSGLTTATTNYGFRGALAVSGTTRWNTYMDGTAPNYFNGYVCIGTNTQVGGAALTVNGAILVSSNVGSLGYGTGAGSTVTQATSRTTGVTLNRPCGAITLVSAAGSAAYQSFTVTNTNVKATDTIIVNQKSGTDKYIIMVTAVGASSFVITFATTGGTTVEQPVFNFSIVGAVAA